MHDGNVLDANDVKYSFLRQFVFDNEHQGSISKNIFSQFYSAMINEIVVDNKFTISFKLKKPNSLFLYILSSPFCAGIISRESSFNSPNNIVPKGTGPYLLRINKEENQNALERFEHYHGGRFDLANIKFLLENQNRLESLAFNDSIDVLFRIRGSQVERFKSNQTFSIYVQESLSTFYLGFNCASYPTSEKYIRILIHGNINKLEAQSIINRTNADLAYGPLPQGLWNTNGHVPVFDSNSKKRITNREVGSIDTKVMTIIGYAPSYRTELLYDAIVKYIRDIGFEVKCQYFSDWQSYFEARESGEYDMFFSTWRSDFVGDPYFFLFSLFHSESSNNYFQYASADVDSLLDLARVTAPRKIRDTYYQRILEAIEDDCPGVFIHHPKEVFVVNKRFSPILIDPYGYIHFEKITTF